MDQRGESSHGSVTDEKKAAGEHVLGVDEYESEMPDMYAFFYCVRRVLLMYALLQLKAVPPRPRRDGRDPSAHPQVRTDLSSAVL